MLLTAAAVVYFTFIQSEYQTTMQLKGERDERVQFVAEQKENIKKINQLVNSYNDKVLAQHLVSVAMPVGPDVASIIAQINTLALSSNLQVQSFSVANSPVAAASASSTKAKEAENVRRPVGTLTFQVRVSGSYNDVKTFLGNIENNVRVMDVKNIALAPSVKNEVDGYAVDITATTYYQTTK